MHKSLPVLVLFILSNILVAQERAFVIYNAKGKKVSYEKMVNEMVKKDLVFFGELHDNPIAHWLQYEVIQDFNESRSIILGAEMFEADNQAYLNDYLQDSIDAKGLDSLARLWTNYKTDYKPIVDFAKEQQIDFVATNIPRRYANLVYRKSFEALDSLSNQEKEWIAPLPIPFDSELSTYKEILSMMGDHGTPELVKAQAIKDATMAHFILNNFKKNHLFIHLNGAYHTRKGEGILWYIDQAKKEIDSGTITTVSQENIDKLLKENRGLGDFIICVDEDMTKTH